MLTESAILLQYNHMNFIVNLYRKNFIQRFDKDDGIPYYSKEDFVGLNCLENTFNNSLGIEVHYFFYNYENYKKDKLVIFLPGIGPGHTAYLAEIELLCKAGYRVLTLDYTGCGTSKGETLLSINEPTRDVIELINLLHSSEEIILIGHSLGAYTSLNVINLLPQIKKAVIISGFVNISDELMGFVKFRFFANAAKRDEKKRDKEYGNIDNWKYLKHTTDKLLFIHSTDDKMVNFKYNTKRVMKLNNPNLSFKIVEGKKHNPNYSCEAIKTMNEWLGNYYYLINQGELKTIEDKNNYFLDKPISKMTSQDQEIWDSIFDFIH